MQGCSASKAKLSPHIPITSQMFYSPTKMLLNTPYFVHPGMTNVLSSANVSTLAEPGKCHISWENWSISLKRWSWGCSTHVQPGEMGTKTWSAEDGGEASRQAPGSLQGCPSPRKQPRSALLWRILVFLFIWATVHFTVSCCWNILVDHGP